MDTCRAPSRRSASRARASIARVAAASSSAARARASAARSSPSTSRRRESATHSSTRSRSASCSRAASRAADVAAASAGAAALARASRSAASSSRACVALLRGGPQLLPQAAEAGLGGARALVLVLPEEVLQLAGARLGVLQPCGVPRPLGLAHPQVAEVPLQLANDRPVLVALPVGGLLFFEQARDCRLQVPNSGAGELRAGFGLSVQLCDLEIFICDYSVQELACLGPHRDYFLILRDLLIRNLNMIDSVRILVHQ